VPALRRVVLLALNVLQAGHATMQLEMLPSAVIGADWCLVTGPGTQVNIDTSTHTWCDLQGRHPSRS
jgi:hypothetical protein